jgi:hypothetical protein
MNHSLRTDLLRDIRQLVAENIVFFTPEQYLIGTPFWEYIQNQLWNPEIQFPFQESFQGQIPFFTDYTLIFQIWMAFRHIKMNQLYLKTHYKLHLLLETVQDNVEVNQVNQMIFTLFRMRVPAIIRNVPKNNEINFPSLQSTS